MITTLITRSRALSALLILLSLTACASSNTPLDPRATASTNATSSAGNTDNACPQHYANADTPQLVNPKLAAKTRLLCFSEFAVLHSGVTRTPLWASEHVTYAELLMDIARKDNFYAEPRLPAEERAELADYAGSGYDRGHLAPAANMPSDTAMRESFSLANMTPQNPSNNRGLWSSIESRTRDLAQQRGEVYVVSGAVFSGANLQRINERVLVPTHYFKAIYDTNTGESGAYWVANTANKDYKTVSIKELTQLAGIDPFPTIGEFSKANAMNLPQP